MNPEVVQSPLHARKKVGNPDEWKRNIAKVAR